MKDSTLFGLYVCRSDNSVGNAQTEFFIKEEFVSTKQPFVSQVKRNTERTYLAVVTESSKRNIGLIFKSNTAAHNCHIRHTIHYKSSILPLLIITYYLLQLHSKFV
ncbi:unnamed protein product [Didymodactylos carnosus]|nr:unnamed protein product [Didymodactylos carnosus]CAF4460220.1 unnamed protein product [Didymodactylos carnosus]